MRRPAIVRIHATDLRPREPGQKTIAAICGLRCSLNRVLYLTSFQEEHVSCVGCRAILLERKREMERANIRVN
jgi:hypothetical protein